MHKITGDCLRLQVFLCYAPKTRKTHPAKAPRGCATENGFSRWRRKRLPGMAQTHAGFALWNFREPSGVLDTERPGTKLEDWEGHKLDRQLLPLLQKKRKA
jgi:hypothetical protein